MSRPRENGDRAGTAIRIPRDLLEEIDREARDRMVSRTKVIEWALRRGLPLLVPVESLDSRESRE